LRTIELRNFEQKGLSSGTKISDVIRRFSDNQEPIVDRGPKDAMDLGNNRCVFQFPIQRAIGLEGCDVEAREMTLVIDP
jgi:hypothetical protein